jgi:hypothetical protein
MATRRRERTLFTALLAAMCAAVLLAYWILFGRAPTVGVVEPDARPVVARVEVTRVTGEAWVTRGGAPRGPLLAGAGLQESDVIETSAGARVELGAGESYQVLLDGSARFAVKEITAELSRFRLDEGLAEATVKGAAGKLLVIDSSDDASVKTRGGRLSVAVSGGRVALGVTEGEAQLGSGGQLVAVRAGQISVAERGRAPSAPAPLPRSLLLKIQWPTVRETNRRRMVVRGRTTPGALVSVGGERVQVDSDGAFTHVLLLREGEQIIEASASDVAGRREKERSPPVVLDTRAPETRFDTRDLWGKRRQ